MNWTSNTTLDTEVLIVGAGPVGLAMAMDLSARGIRTIVLEKRYFQEPPSPKCNHVAARTMESFRRLGLATAIRSAGLPADYPHDVAFRTTVTGVELSRVRIPARAQRFTDRTGPDGWWPTPEPPHRINQIYLEPILLAHVAGLPHVALLNRVELTEFHQTEDEVLATAIDLETGAERRFRARYIVGCEGGRSLVRKGIGATLQGDAEIQHVQSTCIRAPALLEKVGTPAWGYYAINPRRSGTLYAIDGIETWLVHNHLPPHVRDPESVDRDLAIRQILGVGPDFPYEVVSKEDWVSRRLVADRFRDRRAFIAGDSAHLWVPYAGYGMNAGIADGLNLAWHLSACLKGWASESVLDAYERERQPITQQVSHFAMNHAQSLIRMRGEVPASIEETGPRGDAQRWETGRQAYELNVQQFCCAGLNFGYFYDDSPLIAYEESVSPPAYSMGSFTATTTPGCRLPHFWLEDGCSLYDALGQDYTLLRRNPDTDVAPFMAAAEALGVPVTLVDITAISLPVAYQNDLLLCRPDQHIAWRGNTLPGDPAGLLGRLCGRQP